MVPSNKKDVGSYSDNDCNEYLILKSHSKRRIVDEKKNRIRKFRKDHHDRSRNRQGSHNRQKQDWQQDINYFLSELNITRAGTVSSGPNKTKNDKREVTKVNKNNVREEKCQSHESFLTKFFTILKATVTNSQRPSIPKLEVVSRVSSIPIVESGIDVTEKIYHKIRESNSLIRWYLTLGERSLATGVQLALPAVMLFETPIHQLDKFLCKSLDVVEKRVPSIYLPPETMYSETRQYVLRRADSVKQLGTAVLDSRVTAATATALDRALTTADKYVDKYLPPDTQDANDVTSDADPAGESGRAKAVQAVQHGDRLRRKLQRRLTRQALAEAKAIKEQIHVLVYVAELVATDPVLAWKKAKELYGYLSQPEPENQARPETVEQVLVLLARETARKVVHLVNYTHTDLPRNVRQGLSLVTKHLSTAADAVLKTVPVETAITEVKGLRSKLEALLQQLQSTSKVYLEHLAIFLAGNEEREKIAPRSAFGQRDDLTAINGVN